MILGRESFGSLSNHSISRGDTDIEIEDDAPQRKPSLEEIDALEVHSVLLHLYCTILFMQTLIQHSVYLYFMSVVT